MNKIEKICVFCGKEPESKNKEHIIPQWLMNYVGVTGKKVRFGFDKVTGRPREFTYKSFTFPACEKCNLSFSSLEKKAKLILIRLLSEEKLSSKDFHCLLDWFDKVRIGLWLGFYYLDKNYGGISPKFHIQTRIGTQDRMIHIVRVKNDDMELSFRGCDSIAFHFVPSCFSIIINNFCFYNISFPFLIARRIGFPFPAESYMREDGLSDYFFTEGRNRIMRPLLKKQFSFKGTGIYQPIFSAAITDRDNEFYETDYVRKHSLSYEDGIGNIFIEKDGYVKLASDRPSNDWLPKISYERQSMNPAISINTLEYQLHVFSQQPSISKLPKSEQKFWKNNLSVAKRDANWFIAVMKKNAKTGLF